MTAIPFHLRYSLSRWQRLVGLYCEWGWFAPLVSIPLCTFFLLRAGWSIWMLEWAGIALFGGLALVGTCLYAGILGGLVDVALFPVRHVDLTFEDNGAGPAAGVLLGRERWYLFLDGITNISRHCDLWIVQHYNGWRLLIPASAISDEQINCLREAMRRGQTPEGIRAVIERGKGIEGILAEQSRPPPA